MSGMMCSPSMRQSIVSVPLKSGSSDERSRLPRATADGGSGTLPHGVRSDDVDDAQKLSYVPLSQYEMPFVRGSTWFKPNSKPNAWRRPAFVGIDGPAAVHFGGDTVLSHVYGVYVS